MPSPRTRRIAASASVLLVGALLTACGSSNEANEANESVSDGSTQASLDATNEASQNASQEAPATTVSITDNHATLDVPVNPQRVVALDNHVFQTLSDWDVPLVAAPKPIMRGLWPEYDAADVLDVGSHVEPNLESIIAATPDLIIGGYRFASTYPDIVSQNPDAVVIETEPREGGDFGAELKRQTEILGAIFDRADDAAAINRAYDDAVTAATQAYDGSSTVVGLITSGGEIGYVAPVTGRSLGVLFPTLGLVPAIDTAAEDTSHGDDISVEAIAAASPEWIIVLDRDGAGVGEGEYTPAADLIGASQALANVPAVVKGQIIYLSPDFYLTEDIHAYTALYEQIAEAFGSATP